MPRPQRPWFRFYVETINDPKLRRLPPAQRWLWPTAMALARQSPVPGQLLITAAEDQVEPLTLADLIDAAAMPAKDVKAALAEFYRLGMMHTDPDLGCMVVTKFNGRQFESDDVTERTRRHRSKNGDGNDERTSKERSNDVPGNDHEPEVGTPPETEADTELSHPQTTSSGGDPPPEDDEQQQPDGRQERALAACKLIGTHNHQNAVAAGKVKFKPPHLDKCREAARTDHLEQAQQLAHQHPDATPEEIAGEILMLASGGGSNGHRAPGEPDPRGLYAAADRRRLERAEEGPQEADWDRNLSGAAAARAALREQRAKHEREAS